MGLKKMYQQRLDFSKYNDTQSGGRGSVRKVSGEKSEGRLTRRSFMQIGLGILSALAVLEIGGISLLYLRPRKRTEEFSGVTEAGPVEDFPPGSVTEFQKGNFYLIRSQEGGFLAVYRRCPHLGCSVNYDPDHDGFLCPCHASSFDFHGDYESPPVPRALDTFEVTIEDGLVMVNTSRKQRREHYAPEQLVHQVESL
jgi:cytochrome b6-f complex iron-sulfur subunit